MQVRCPHCQTPIELASDGNLSDIACPSCGSSFSLLGSDETLAHAPESKSIGHFDLVEQVGIGTFGTVWKARDKELDRLVAVKIPRKGQLDPEETEQFLREARAAAQLRHENIVSVHEVGREQDTVFIVSDFVEGVTLADRLTGQRFSVREAAELCAKIADALHHAHEAGVIHRDLKPGNIILDAHGEPHIMDFGLARREAGEVTMTVEGRVIGTPAYMSPEQAKGAAHTADRRSDVYSLGVILFELLTGERPFRGNIRMLVHQVINDEPPSPRRLNGSVPRDLETIVLKCMEKLAEKRYPTAQALGDDTRRFLNGETIAARPVTRSARVWRWCKRNPAVSGLLATLILVLTFGFCSVTILWTRADREYERANLERNMANQNLHDALIREADTIRLARQSGYRRFAEDRLLQAMELKVPRSNREEMRQVAVNCMGDFMALEPTVWDDFASSILHVAIDTTGQYLAVALENGTVAIRDIHSKHTTYLSIGPSPVNTVGFGPGGKTLACSARDGSIQVWEHTDDGEWRVVRKFLLQKHAINGVGMSQDGQQLLVLHHNKSRVAVYDLSAAVDEPAFVDSPEMDDAHICSFSMNGKLKVTAEKQDGVWQATVWDVANAQELKTVTPDVGELFNINFDLNTRAMVCWGLEGARLFDLTRFRAVTYDQGDGAGQLYAVSLRHKLVARVSRRLNRVELGRKANEEVGTIPHPDPEWPMYVTFSEDGQFLVTARSQSVRVWRLKSQERVLCVGHVGGIRCLTYNHTGSLLASGGVDRTVRIWNPATGALIHTLSGFEDVIRSIAFSPDETLFLAVDARDILRAWKTDSWDELKVLQENATRDFVIREVMFSPRDDILAACGPEGVIIWEAAIQDSVIDQASVTLNVRFRPHEGSLARRLRFSADGSLLAWETSLKGKQEIRIWDGNENELLGVLLQPTNSVDFAFSPTGTHLAVLSNGVVEVLNTSTKQREFCFNDQIVTAHQNVYLDLCVQYSGNGRWLASGTKEARLTIWDIETRKRLFFLPTSFGHLICWSPDATQIAHGGGKSGPHIWNMSEIRSRLAHLRLEW